MYNNSRVKQMFKKVLLKTIGAMPTVPQTSWGLVSKVLQILSTYVADKQQRMDRSS